MHCESKRRHKPRAKGPSVQTSVHQCPNHERQWRHLLGVEKFLSEDDNRYFTHERSLLGFNERLSLRVLVVGLRNMRLLFQQIDRIREDLGHG